MLIEFKGDAPTPAVIGFHKKAHAPYDKCLSAAVRYALQCLALQYGKGAYDWCIDDEDPEKIDVETVRSELVHDVLTFLIYNQVLVPQREVVRGAEMPVLSNAFHLVIEQMIDYELHMVKVVDGGLRTDGLGHQWLPRLDLPLPLDVIFPLDESAESEEPQIQDTPTLTVQEGGKG